MSIYNVPVIPLNLRKEETVIQIAESLNYLCEMSNDIFKRINARIQIDTGHLNSLNDRIDKVNGKILKISGAKRAIQVFSSSKYPAADLNVPYKTVFDNEDVPAKQKFSVKYKEVPVKDEPLETLQFYHLNFADNQKHSYDGLGKIPKNNIDNVNDLLLYNSGTNLYSKYIIADTLKNLRKTKKEVIKEGPEIGAAPLSISEPGVISKHTGQNYFYSPHLGDVPAIDVPIDLPDLPGIADDLRYTDKSDRTIAPSVITSPNIPELPDIVQVQDKPETTLPIQEVKQEIEIPKPLPKAVAAAPIEAENVPSIKPDKPHEETEHKPTELPKSKETPVAAQTKPVIPDAHAMLMDAIRKAGGAKKLKATEPRKEIEVDKPAAGDLMADLHSKLLLRRKGISGTEKTNDIEPKSAMDRISAMLPPPPTKPDQCESGTTDDDWDD